MLYSLVLGATIVTARDAVVLIDRKLALSIEQVEKWKALRADIEARSARAVAHAKIVAGIVLAGGVLLLLNRLQPIRQLPQFILGSLLRLKLRPETASHKGIAYFKFARRSWLARRMSATALYYIFIPDDRKDLNKVVRHEYGHTLDGARLGWLYLLLVGLPSITCNIIARAILPRIGWSPERIYEWYYALPWEKRADMLGGVKRK